MSKETILFICFSCIALQAIIWFAADPRKFQEKMKQSSEPKRILFNIQSALFIAIYLIISYFLSWPSTDKDYTWVSLGLLIYLSGSLFAIWARFTMNKFWGIPAQHDEERQTKLIADGPFSFSRNPIYLGILLLFIGFSLALRSYSILLVPVVFYVIYKTILVEEKLLHKKFGKEYEKYMKKVPRFV